MSARVGPGSKRELGLPIWAFARLAGRVTGTGPPHVFTTLGRTRGLFWGWLHFAGRLMPGGTLPRSDTELVILRVAEVRESAYEQAHHRRLARRVGVTDVEIERVPAGPDAEGWTPRQALLLRATDQLLATRDLDDETWAQVLAHIGERTAIELVLLVGHYDMLATTLHTLRVELD